MTWIYDDTGRYWMDPPPIKKRAKPKGRRFADVKVGDQLMQANPSHDGKRQYPTIYSLVTDAWFDPVRGEDDEEKGHLFAVQQLGADGQPRGRKAAFTRFGLASQGYQYADIDYIGLALARASATDVVGIGHAQVIRARPKIPTGSL